MEQPHHKIKKFHRDILPYVVVLEDLPVSDGFQTKKEAKQYIEELRNVPSRDDSR